MKLVIMIAVPALTLSTGAAVAQVNVTSQGVAAPDQADVKTESAAVPYTDLDLMRPDGRATLERRVATAIDRVCGDPPLAVEVRRQQQFSECRQQVASSANQELAALYSSQGVMTARLYVNPWPR
jgi:UrcA family protein